MRIFVYNVFMRPSFLFQDGQVDRCVRMLRVFANRKDKFDVFVFCELFDAHIVDLFKILFKDWWVSPAVCSHPKMQGGVFVFTRLPVVEFNVVPYVCSSGADSLVSKGFAHVKVFTGDCIVDVIGTHMQNVTDEASDRVWRNQWEQIQTYILYNHIDTVVIAGDLNKNMSKDKSCFTYRTDNSLFNFDTLFGQTEDSGFDTFLDHVLVLKKATSTTSISYMKNKMLKVGKKLFSCSNLGWWNWFLGTKKRIRDLSDHDAIISTILFS